MNNDELFRNNILNSYGEEGKQWLNQLPLIIQNIASQYNLSELKQINNLSYNYLLSGLKKNKPIILKLSFDKEALKREAAALNAFSGYGCINLLEHEDHMILLEKAIPGISLKIYLSKKKEQAINIACKLAQKLHQAPIPEHHSFPYIAEMLKIIDNDWNISINYLKTGRRLRDKLLSINIPQVLLHGDLHYDNIIKDNNNWVIIDPHGTIGYPVNEMWAFIMDIEEDTKYIAKFFNFDLKYVREWYFLHLLLNICQALKHNTTPKLFMNLIEETYLLISKK